jgi:hypothetical protein
MKVHLTGFVKKHLVSTNGTIYHALVHTTVCPAPKFPTIVIIGQGPKRPINRFSESMPPGKYQMSRDGALPSRLGNATHQGASTHPEGYHRATRRHNSTYQVSTPGCTAFIKASPVLMMRSNPSEPNL